MSESTLDRAVRCALGWGRANLVVRAVRDHHVPTCRREDCRLCHALAVHDRTKAPE